MATLDAFRVVLDDDDYPDKYAALLSYLETLVDELIAARQGEVSLAANFSRRIAADAGLFSVLDANGYRLTGLPAPVAGADAVNKVYADGLSFAAALPAQIGNGGKWITTDGTTAYWADPLPARSAVTKGKSLINDGATYAWRDVEMVTAESLFFASLF